MRYQQNAKQLPSKPAHANKQNGNSIEIIIWSAVISPVLRKEDLYNVEITWLSKKERQERSPKDEYKVKLRRSIEGIHENQIRCV